MKNYILILGFLFGVITLGQSDDNEYFYEKVCNETVVDDDPDTTQVNWFGVAGALAPVVALIPELIVPEAVITVLGGIFGTMGNINISTLQNLTLSI